MINSQQRFDRKVDKNGPRMPHMDTHCWLWTGATDKGYGMVRVDKVLHQAHRKAWEYATGSHPGSMCVLHCCDNRLCVNPEHLHLGTRIQNNLEAKIRGRFPDRKGTAGTASKITEFDALIARALFRAGAPLQHIRKKLGLSRSATARLLKCQTWRHIEGLAV